MNTHNLICDFGKYTGILYTRIPVSYLMWMINIKHEKANIAKAELKRRGTILPTLDISGHAIDRASLKCQYLWKEDRKENEGLYSWLIRISMEALSKFKLDKDSCIFYKKMKLAFTMDGEWPILKTVMRQ